MSTRTRWGCVALIVYPIVEIALAIAVASVVGWWWVLVYAVVCLVLGLGLVRYALSASGRSFSVAMAALRGPAGEQVLMIEGARPVKPPAPPAQTLLIVPAGLLIAVPGLVTTIIGLVLWVPYVRRRIAARMQARIETTVRFEQRYNPPGDSA